MPDTLPKALARNAVTRGERPANREKKYGIWQIWTWAEVTEEVRALALGLAAHGLKPGDRLAIVGDNRPHLYWAMYAAQSLGAIPVPLYQDAVSDELGYVVGHAGASMVVAEDQEQVDKLLAMKDSLPELREIIYVDPRGMRNYGHEHLHSFADVQAAGRAADAAAIAKLDARIDAGNGDDVCIILYTSGTTGQPKGVVLTFDNVLQSSHLSVGFDQLGAEEETIAYLPMAWVGDYIFSVGQSCIAGFCVSCPESRDTLLQDLREVGPSYFFAPPRIFESMLTTIMVRMADASAPKRRVFDCFIELARRVGPSILIGERVGLRDRWLYWLGNVLVYGPLRNALGLGRVRIGYTAGEAIGPETFNFYRAIGVNLKQLYGQTEATVFVAGQTDEAVYPDTVGAPTPEVELRIAENNEVLYRSPGVFREYYKNPEATQETLTADGWVRSGDAGYIDESTGQLRILDRAKDVGRLASGAIFSPKYIENKLKFYPNIQEAVVIGHERDAVVAMINIDLSAVSSWAERNDVTYASYQELAARPEVYDIIRGHVEEVNRTLADDPQLTRCQIQRFLILHKELDADDGELTRTRKVRRRIINERYGELVDALYSDRQSVVAQTEVTYEDGRKGMIEGDLRIAPAATFAAERQAA